MCCYKHRKLYIQKKRATFLFHRNGGWFFKNFNFIKKYKTLNIESRRRKGWGQNITKAWNTERDLSLSSFYIAKKKVFKCSYKWFIIIKQTCLRTWKYCSSDSFLFGTRLLFIFFNAGLNDPSKTRVTCFEIHVLGECPANSTWVQCLGKEYVLILHCLLLVRWGCNDSLLSVRVCFAKVEADCCCKN